MSEHLIKNIEHSQIHVLADLIDYKPGKVASITLTQKRSVGMTLFAIDKGEGLSTHSATGDAMAQILEGSVEITIDGVAQIVKAGETIIMPAEIPHGLKAVEAFKFLLTVVKMEDKKYQWKPE